VLREIASRTAIGIAVAVSLGFPGKGAAAERVADDGPQWPTIRATNDGPAWPNVPALKGDGPQWPNLSASAKPIADDLLTTGTTLSPPVVRKAPPLRFVEKAEPAFSGELGIRYWFSWSQSTLDLYDIAGTGLVSRLTYDGMNGHNAEVFGRFDNNNGFYLKTYLGGGWLVNGRLTDEDFPPLTSPYSRTYSDQHGGTLAYGAVDLGYNIFERSNFRLGAFAGYHFMMERMSAFGCVQVGNNPGICGGNGFPTSVEGITQNNTWQSLRVGLDADLKLTKQLTLSADAAYLPFVYLLGTDRHLLRIGTAPGDFTGGIPEDGTGWGYQLELALSYAFDENVKVALGGRWWHMETGGHADFENMIVGGTGFQQRLDWKTDQYGLFVQGSFKFGPYPTGTLW
jgi:hypothetical protein